MTPIEVGELYHPQRTTWPELAQYNYDANGHHLTLFFEAPSTQEKLAVKRGPWRFALYEHGSVLFLCHRSKTSPWSDSPYSWHRVPLERRQVPPVLEGDERAVLGIVLVDAATGVVEAIRSLSWSPDFSTAVHEAIRRQIESPYEPGQHNADINEAYKKHSSVRSMVKAAFAQSGGGR